MLIAAVLCLCAAVVIGAAGLWLLARPRPGDPVRQALRAVAPPQLAAAVMLAAGAVVAFSGNLRTGVVVLIVCVVGAVATIAAGCWQIAKAVARTEAGTGAAAGRGCGGGACASCTLSCR